MQNILKNKEFIKWCYKWITELTLVSTSNWKKLKPYSIEENLWWNKLIWQEWNNQWTTLLCEWGVKELLEKLWYKNIRNARKLQSSFSDKKYNPDWECDNYVWEVKWRNWTTPWTAWEKILWTPLKYSEIPRLYWKPLIIVCVWYQEWEAKNWFACGNLTNLEERWTEELGKMLLLFKKLNIEYVWFTDLLEKLKG
jgi:hypothetical protein